jgi:hypothetical protein
MRQFRFWSALQGLGYLLASVSLLLYPPGAITRISTQDHDIILPAHPTAFQQFAGGHWTWTIFFGVGALLLLTVGWWDAKRLGLVHGLMLAGSAAFGVGYFVGTLFLGTGWLTGALALGLAAGHGMALALRPTEVRP